MNPIILAHLHSVETAVDILCTAERDTLPTFTKCQYVTSLTGLLTGIRKASYMLATLPRTVKPYRDSVDGTRDRVTYRELVTR